MRADVVIRNLLDADGYRVYPIVVPQTVDASDCVVYNIVETSPVQSQTMEVNTSFVKIQLSIFHNLYDRCQSYANAITDSLQGKSGTVTIEETNYKYNNMRIVNREDLGFDEESNVFMVALDVRVMMIA